MDCLIWDWNGTLLDDLALSNSALNTLLARHGYAQRYDEDGYKAIFGFPIVDYYLRAGFDFSRHPFSELAAEYIALYDPASLDCTLCPGANEALAAVKKAGLKQVILSASKLDTLQAQVNHFGLLPFFDELVGQTDFYAHGKLDTGKAWLSRQSFAPSRITLVGDTLHDAEVAAALGVNCVLCAAGHHSRATLQTAGVPVINTLHELPAQLGL